MSYFKKAKDSNIKKTVYRLILTLFIFALLIFQMTGYQGCSEDPASNPVTPPTPVVSDIGTITVTPDILVVNVSDTILVRLNAKSGVYFTDSLAKLIRVDNNNNEISVVGNLYDNGSLSSGDEIARDNIYSGKFIITQTSEGTVYYSAKGNVNSGGTVSSKQTPAVQVSVYGSLNSGQVSVVLNTQKNAATQLNTYLAGNPNNIETATNQLKTWLESQPGVASVEKGDNTSMLIEYTNGLSGGMIISVEGKETRGGIETDTLSRNKLVKIPADRQTSGENTFGNSFSRNYEPDNNLSDPNAIGNRKVMVFAAYEGVWTNDERPLIIARLNNAPCKEFEITSYVDNQANISALYNITQYGYIVFATHGSKGKAILTAEIVDTNLAVYKETYKALLQAKRISIFKNIKVNSAGGVNVIADVYAITNKFISALEGTFPNSVILNNSCASTQNPDLANAFIGKGAKTYYGYNKTVNGAFAKTIADSITKRLAITGLTTGNAYFAASDPQDPFAAFEKGTGNNNDLKYSTSITNGDFEEGNIFGWTKSGDGRVINRLGYLSANQGTFMGIISTGLGYTTTSGSLSQCLKVENNQSTITLNWNFLSEEFLEYIHSPYQDFFKIKLKRENGTEVVLLSKTIDQIALAFGADTNHAGQLISVSPDIVFDVGGVYMTGWQPVSFDITPYRGQTIVIVFECGDVGDSIFDSAILIDAVKVN